MAFRTQFIQFLSFGSSIVFKVKTCQLEEIHSWEVSLCTCVQKSEVVSKETDLVLRRKLQRWFSGTLWQSDRSGGCAGPVSSCITVLNEWFSTYHDWPRKRWNSWQMLGTRSYAFCSLTFWYLLLILVFIESWEIHWHFFHISTFLIGPHISWSNCFPLLLWTYGFWLRFLPDIF